jgi:hypothetical protein
MAVPIIILSGIDDIIFLAAALANSLYPTAQKNTVQIFDVIEGTYF